MSHGDHTISLYSPRVGPGRRLMAYCEDCEVRTDLPLTWVKICNSSLLLKYGRGYDLAPKEFAAG